MKTYKIASIPGDGIGVEAVDADCGLYALAERTGTFHFMSRILIGVLLVINAKVL